MKEFEGKVALVTDGGSGIGLRVRTPGEFLREEREARQLKL